MVSFLLTGESWFGVIDINTARHRWVGNGVARIGKLWFGWDWQDRVKEERTANKAVLSIL